MNVINLSQQDVIHGDNPESPRQEPQQACNKKLSLPSYRVALSVQNHSNSTPSASFKTPKLVTANWSGQFYDFHPAWIHPEHMRRLCQAGTHPQCHPIGQEGTPQQHHRLEQLQDQVNWRIQEKGHLWQRGQPDFRPPSSLWIHKNWLNWISPNNTRSFVIGVQQMYDLEHRLRWARWRRTIGPTPLFMTQRTLCTVKGFQSDHYPLNWSWGVAKLSSSGILELISKNQVCPSSTQTHHPAYKSNYSSTMGPPRCANWDTSMMGSLSTAMPACTAARPPPSPSPRQAPTDQFYWWRTFYVLIRDFSLGVQNDTGCQIPISPPTRFTLHVLLRDLLQGESYDLCRRG